ncbi:MAG TPA: hypothetical protein VGY54_25935 [Polyangiaceae bacterium]|jgi:uncharacterized protein (DUF1778 family)|nr:hypothetical protein [Polyangiaceae bacterium]
MADTKKRRKPKALRKEKDIRIRVTDAQKRTLVDAAAKSGIGVSSWLLTLGLREAQKADGGG